MNWSAFFLKRPVFAIILNFLLIILGFLSFRSLPVAEFPSVSNLVISIQTFYPNASAEIVENEVTFPLEEAVAGVEGVEEISSTSHFNYSYIRLSFGPKTEIIKALTEVREKVSQARYQLPDTVKEPIIGRDQRHDVSALSFSLQGEDYRLGQLSHFAHLYLKNALKSIPGVAKVEINGPAPVMRLKLEPLKMFTLGIGINQVVEKLKEHHLVLPAGRFKKELPITLETLLKTPEDFGNIILQKKGESLVFLKDIAKIQEDEDQNWRVRVNGKSGIGINLYKTSEGNVLQISDAARALIPQLQKSLPNGVHLMINTDNADFVRASLKNIQVSFWEAFLLVFLVCLVFLRSITATLIPFVTIPISIIGSFIFMRMFGLSINTLTLLAMVLAVGLVVDDAIVVIENIHRHHKQGHPLPKAALLGAKEVSFAIIAMTFTLASVYAPLLFIEGIVGELFREFAITLAGAVIISGITAITLSPLMTTKFLTPSGLFSLKFFEDLLQKLEKGYEELLHKTFKRLNLLMLGLGIIIGLTAWFYILLPKEIAPSEDRGLIGIWIAPLAGKTIKVFDSYVQQAEKLLTQFPEVKNYTMWQGDWGAQVVASLVPWSQRKRSADQIVEELKKEVKEIPTVEISPWSWNIGLPNVEFSSQEGLTLSFEAQTTGSYQELNKEIKNLCQLLEKEKIFSDVSQTLRLDYPGLRGEIDTQKVAQYGLKTEHIALVLQALYSEAYPLQFSKDNQRYDIIIEALKSPRNLYDTFITTEGQKKIPLGAVLKLTPKLEPKELAHYNQLRSTRVHVSLKPGQKFNEAMVYLEKKITEVLPKNIQISFVGAVKQFQESSSLMILLFFTALLFIYSVLAIQFESFIDPLIIIGTVPFACAGGLMMLWCTGQSLNIYSQIGLITLTGLITKHGILIVEFANQLSQQGQSYVSAAIRAACLRLRPILMTTGAMLFGALPLIFSSGAGAEVRHVIGSVLLGGLILGTVLTLFVIPVTYSLVKQWQTKLS